MTEYGVIYEQADDGGWWASTVDLPVFAAGDSKTEAEREIRSAIAFYLEYLEEQGETAPAPATSVGTVTI
jgi:predicted RNase H-like HicB family nuclease